MKNFFYIVVIFGLFLVTSLSGCGGGGGGGSSTQVSIDSFAAEDGTIRNDGGLNKAGADTEIGDYLASNYFRLFLYFKLDTIPAGATITAAKLYLYQGAIHNGTPYTDLGGQVRVDHIDYGTTLEVSDIDYGGVYTCTLINSNIWVPATAAGTGWHSHDVTSYVKYDFAQPGKRSQYQIYFATNTDGDAVADTEFWSCGNDLTNRPRLEVTYKN